jgi:hypothetical protein
VDAEHLEACAHAWAPNWRDWYAYYDRLLDSANDARTVVDTDDLERLWRADTAPGGVRPGTTRAVVGENGPEAVIPLRGRPFDHGADWAV